MGTGLLEQAHVLVDISRNIADGRQQQQQHPSCGPPIGTRKVSTDFGPGHPAFIQKTSSASPALILLLLLLPRRHLAFTHFRFYLPW